MMLHIKYDCNWPTGFRDIHVSEIFMFESVKRHTDRRTQAHTDAGSSPNLYAHSGELKSLNLRLRQHVCSANVK